MLKQTATAFQPVNIQDIVLRIVARISARVFVGLRLCRNEKWLTTSVDYTVSLFITLITLRIVPAFLRPVFVWLLPSAYKIHHHLRIAQHLIVPLIDERREAEAQNDISYEKAFDLLQWMMDAANTDEAPAPKIAHRVLLMSFAAIHTTTAAATSALYDLCAHPEYFAPLREEVEQAILEDGGWKKSTVTKFRKLDSFLKESQRLNPPSIRKLNQA
jgi:cytochrome P450